MRYLSLLLTELGCAGKVLRLMTINHDITASAVIHNRKALWLLAILCCGCFDLI